MTAPRRGSTRLPSGRTERRSTSRSRWRLWTVRPITPYSSRSGTSPRDGAPKRHSARAKSGSALAFAGAQEGVWDWNLETGAVVYSPRWKQMLGYADDEIEPHVSAWERLLHPEDCVRADELSDEPGTGRSRPTKASSGCATRTATTSTCCRAGLPVRARARRTASCASSARTSTSPSASAPKRRCAKARSGSRWRSPARRKASGTGTSRPAPSCTRRAGSRCSGTADDEIEPHVRAWERLLHPDDRRAPNR